MIVLFGAGARTAFPLAKEFQKNGRLVLGVSRKQPKFLKAESHFHYDEMGKCIAQMRAWRDENAREPLTVLILSALSQDKLFGLLTPGELEMGLDVNIKTPLLFCNAIIKNFKSLAPLNLIYLSSFRSTAPTKGVTIYAPSKSFFETFVKCSALEMAPLGIRINTIRIGFLDGGLVMDGKLRENQKQIVDRISLKRFATMIDVFTTINQIECNEYLNGSLIDLTGGLDFNFGF